MTRTTQSVSSNKTQSAYPGKVYCPLCTHTVDALIEVKGRHYQAKAGQKCPRCSSSLDAGYIMRYDRAA